MASKLELAVAIISRDCENEPDLMTRLRKAMKSGASYWMDSDDDLRFRASVGAALVTTMDEGEKERITKSIESLCILSAILVGVTVDMDAAEAHNNSFEQLPLIRLWRDANGRA